MASDAAQLAQLLKAGVQAEEPAAAASPPSPSASFAPPGLASPVCASAAASHGVQPAERCKPAGPAEASARGGQRLPRELAVLFWRTLTGIWRTPALLLLHWALAIASGALAGVIFFQVGSAGWCRKVGVEGTAECLPVPTPDLPSPATRRRPAPVCTGVQRHERHPEPGR